MTTYAIISLAGLLVWTLYGILGPVVKKDNFAWHNAMFVHFPRPYTGLSFGPAVWTQETGEWRLSKLLGLLVGYSLWTLFLPYTGVLFVPLIAIAIDSFTVICINIIREFSFVSI